MAIINTFPSNSVDLSSDTVTADVILSGYTAHNAAGQSITGTCTGVQISVPESGENTFWVAIPKGTANPDPSDENDWVKFMFSVDSYGNAQVV